jgi:serine/threonine protein kinase
MAVAPRLVPGTIFARDYRVIELLAEGGMGAVYRTEQLSTRKLRALKLVSTRLASDPKGRQRFVREATIGASIDSEHVVEVIGAGIDDDTDCPWLAMELLDGADLGAVVLHQGPLSPAQLREVAGQLCHGLAAAHRAGVVHRDLKPANVFIARSRRAGVPFTLKILDFGIAKVVQESGSASSETDTVGSPLWMAPEQLNAQRPTPATDVWALGLLAFWALTGKHYWLAAHAEATTVQALFVEQLFKPLDPPSRRAVDLGVEVAIPAGFDDWFLACTQREPTRRFVDAWAASEALGALLPADPEAAASLLPTVSLPPSVSSTDRHHGAGSETTAAAAGAQWDASAVVPAAAVAAARTGVEHEATRADTPSLAADLSRTPLPSASASRSRGSSTSPLAVTLGVAAVVGVLATGGFMAWQQWGRHATPGVSDDAVVQHEASPSADDTATNNGDADGATSSAPLVDEGPVDPKQELVVPVRAPDAEHIFDVRFLGWSAAGHRFVLEVDYQAEHKGTTSNLELVQVHDALTGILVESFVTDREVAQASQVRAFTRATTDAKPRAQWAARRDALQLYKRSPDRNGPGRARLGITTAEPPPGTRVSFPHSPVGAAFRWDLDPVAAQASPSRAAPEVTLSLERGKSSFTLLRFEPPFKSHQLLARAVPGAEEVALVGRMLAFWSPDGERVLLLLETDARPTGELPLTRRRWAVRAVGPQIRIVEAGAGQPRAREIAAGLAAAGLPVTSLELRAPTEAGSKLAYPHDRRGAPATAEQVRAALPPELSLSPQAERLERGATDIVLVLGYDAQ